MKPIVLVYGGSEYSGSEERCRSYYLEPAGY